MKYLKVISITFVVFFIISIGIFLNYKNPYDVIIPIHSNHWNSSFYNSISGISDEDLKILKQYLERHDIDNNELSETIPINLTVKNAIDIEKYYVNSPETIQQQQLALQNKIKETYKTNISNSLFITYIEKNNTVDTFSITYAFKNKSKMPIVSFEGIAQFIDKNKNNIESISLKKTIAIPVGKTLTYIETYSKDSVVNFDLLQQIHSNDLDCQFIVNKIVFENGTILELHR